MSGGQNTRDVFTVEQILSILDVKLSDIDQEGESVRRNGFHMTIEIRFVHDHFGRIKQCRYIFSKVPIEGRSSHVEREIHKEGGFKSILHHTESKGLRIRLKIAGSTGSFSMPNVLLNVVSSLGLISGIQVAMNFYVTK